MWPLPLVQVLQRFYDVSKEFRHTQAFLALIASLHIHKPHTTAVMESTVGNADEALMKSCEAL